MLRLVYKVLRWLAGSLLLLATLVVGYLAAALIGAVIPSPSTHVPPTGEPRQIYLLTSLLHADIAIPADDALRARFGFLKAGGLPVDHPSLRYLVFGWGAREFYLKTPHLAGLRPGPALRGIFGDASVMHVLAAAEIANSPGAVAVGLPPGGLERLLAFIEAGFRKDAAGVALIEGVNYGMADAFYEGEGGFNILRPCNVWVAEGLRKAGLVTGVWTPTTYALKLGLSLHSPQALQ